MYDTTRPVEERGNLIAAAQALVLADSSVFSIPWTPLQTDGGVIPMHRQIMYRRRNNVTALVWRTLSKTFVALSGMMLQSDADIFIEGAWPLPRWNPDQLGRCNAASQLWYRRMRDALRSDMNYATTDVYIWGHSMGGTIAHLLASEVAATTNGGRAHVITFGTPRWCDMAWHTYHGQYEQIRIMNHGDPITYVMPRSEEAPVVFMAIGRSRAESYNAHVHTPEGWVLRDDGGMVYGNSPRGFETPHEFHLFQLIQNAAEARSTHGIGSYANRLQMGASTPAVPPNVIQQERRHNPPERPVTLPPQPVFRRQQEQTQATIDAQLPLPEWVRSSRSRVQVRRVDGTYLVLLDGNTFYVASSRLDARGFANALRMFLRQYTQNPGRVLQRGDFLSWLRGEQAPNNNLEPVA